MQFPHPPGSVGPAGLVPWYQVVDSFKAFLCSTSRNTGLHRSSTTTPIGPICCTVNFINQLSPTTYEHKPA